MTDIPIKSGTSLDDVLPHIRTLDLIFFSGPSAMSSAIICCQKRRQHIVDGEPIFSHCGVAVRGKDLNTKNPHFVSLRKEDGDILGRDIWNIDPDEVYILEAQLTTKSEQIVGKTSCMCGLSELCTGLGAKFDYWKCGCEKLIYGVLFRKLKDVMIDYDLGLESIIHYGELNRNPFRTANVSIELKDRFTELFLHYRTLPYDYGCFGINMFAVVCTACRPCRACITCGETAEAVVCSELAAIVYVDMNIIPATTKTANVSPMDFLDYEQDRNGIPKGTMKTPTQLITVYPSVVVEQPRFNETEMVAQPLLVENIKYGS